MIRASEPKDKKRNRPRSALSNPQYHPIQRRSSFPPDDARAVSESDLSDPDTIDYDDDDKTIVISNSDSRQTAYLAGWLVELNDDDQPVRSYQLFNTQMSIGRNQANDIVLDSGTVSRRHCHIEYQDGKLMLYDNDAANQTKVDDKPIKICCLKENHVISMGRKRFKIKYL